jgi:hypothetical protein
MSLLRVGGGGVMAAVDPTRGGKIVSLVDRNGKEWLAQPSRRSAQPVRGDATFTQSDPAGWDECAPSIDACSVGGRAIPDHGDLWTAAWKVHRAGDRTLDMWVDGRSLDYRFGRRITATKTGLRFEYEATALKGPTPFLWAAHPQFVSPTGSSVELPPAVRTVIDVLAPGSPTMAWSDDIASTDSLAVGDSRKVYVDPATQVSSAILCHPDGARLNLSWTGCAFLGLWFDHCAYSREPVIAIEPSLGFRDSLAWAVEYGIAPMLEPGRPLQWSLEVAIQPAI